MGRSQRLRHLVGVNGFFRSLAREARRHPGMRLVEWWSERRCEYAWGDYIHPDGYGRWREDDGEVDFLLEYDRGTETLDRLAAKLPGYEDFY